MKCDRYHSINGRSIGPQFPPYILAELSANHNGSIERAIESINAAKRAGADGVKIQTYTADTMTIDCNKDEFRIEGGLWDGYHLYELYKWAETPFEWHKTLFEHARKIDFTLFSTPFDETAVDLLEDLNTPAYKVASFEIVDLPLIKYIATTGKPIIMSTGMANEQEIDEAVQTARDAGCRDLIVLHCVSAYPTPVEEANLHTIKHLANRFNVLTGLSDHTMGTLAPVVATTLGACFIEKHFTLSRQDKDPTQSSQLNLMSLPIENGYSSAFESLGVASYTLRPAEVQNIRFRRSLYFVEDIKQGETIQPHHVRRIRPGFGIAPKHFASVIGRRASVSIDRGTAVRWDLLEKT